MRTPRRDGGYTLIELLVTMTLLVLVLVGTLSAAITVSRAATDTGQFVNMNEQARVTFERLTRELRQASEIRAVTLPTSSGGSAAFTFGVDFDGDELIEQSVLDPEIITYRYDAPNQTLTLTANDEDGTAVTRPILADEVTAFRLEFRSTLWQHDTNADGVTTWQELDATVGNRNGVLDTPEIDRIDMVQLTLTVMDGEHQQTYQTQVGLRNKSQN